MSLFFEPFRHIDLKEISGRMAPGASPRSYLRSMPGQSDYVLMFTSLILREAWRDGPRSVRFDEIERHPRVSLIPNFSDRLPAVLKRLARIRQIKLDIDREGAVITPGKAWIET